MTEAPPRREPDRPVSESGAAGRAVSGRRLCGAALLAGCAAVAAALAIPVPMPEGALQANTVAVVGPPADTARAALPAEDFGALLASRRWGTDAPEPRPVAEPAVPPALVDLHYLGTVAVGERRVVLLDLPEIGIVRFGPGDTLPDGRVLVSIADDSLTLKAEDRPEEVLALFPPVAADGDPDAVADRPSR